MAIAVVGACVPAAAASAAAPRVTTTVIAKGGAVLVAPRALRAQEAQLRVDGRTCDVPVATPLAALVATRLTLRTTADGACSPSAYFVTSVAGRPNRGRDGWAYKVGRRAGTASAANRSGSFGTGRRLASGDVVTWFWCELSGRGCQRTLGVKVLRGATVRVMGYDDEGRGIRVRRARVTVTDGRGRRTTGLTNARGEFRMRGVSGRLKVTARRDGFVPRLPGGLQ